MKKSILWGSALLIAALVASSCNKSTEPSETTYEPSDTTKVGGGGTTGTTTEPGKVTVSPASTTMLDSVIVTIVALQKGDTIVYTTSGVDPIATDEIYTKPIVLRGGAVIKARALRNGKLGTIASATYVVTTRLSKPSFPNTSRIDTFYSAPVEFEVEAANVAEDSIRYTRNGADPMSKSPYIASGSKISVTQSTRIIARSFNGANQPSDPETLDVIMKVAKPTASLAPGGRDSIDKVFFSSTSGGSIRYTKNGTTPSCADAVPAGTFVQTDSVLVDSNVTFKVIGCKPGWTSSEIYSVSYFFKVGTLSFTPDSGTYVNPPDPVVKTRTPDVSVFFTRDSSAPTWDTVSFKPTGTTEVVSGGAAIKMQSAKSVWIRAIGARKGWKSSEEALRRFIVEGDTMLVMDFEQGSLRNPIGTNLKFFGCGDKTGGCYQTAVAADLPTPVTSADGNHPELGFLYASMNFGIADNGATFGMDGHEGPGYAGMSIQVPSAKMGETYRITFWARWVKGVSSLPDTVPMVVEMALKGNDAQNGYYTDGFHRRIEVLSEDWKQYVIDYQALRPAGNAYANITEKDSADPKDYHIFPKGAYKDSAYMVNMGLTKFQGWVANNNTWTPKWKHDIDHLDWIKSDIVAFRWSVIQPMTDVGVAAKVSGNVGIRGVPDRYCGDCHYPYEPEFDATEKAALLKNLKGKFQIDRIQVIRRPQ